MIETLIYEQVSFSEFVYRFIALKKSNFLRPFPYVQKITKNECLDNE